MGLWEYFYAYINYALTYFCATHIFVNFSLAKPKIRLRVTLFVVAELALCLLCACTYELQEKLTNTDFLSYLCICIQLGVFIIISSTESLSKRFYNIIAGTMVRHAATKLVTFVFIFVSIENIYVSATIRSLIILLSYVPVYCLLGRRISEDSEFSPRMYQLIFIFFMNTVIFMLAYIEPLLEKGGTANIMLVIIEISYCYFVLGVQFIQYVSEKRMAHVIHERESIKRRMGQYEHFQSVIDVMNEKCHNLKHQVRNLLEKQAIDEKIVGGLTQTISEYEAFVKTGNEEMDVILTEKHYECMAQHIAMNCIVDGKPFLFLDIEDLNSLFGNAVDNAIEYLKTVEEEKRFLQIFSTKTEYFLKISFENYFEGQIEFHKNGLPVSKKKDEYYHGFGTRSIAKISKRYGGAASFSVEDGLFKTEVLFPLKTVKNKTNN